MTVDLAALAKLASEASGEVWETGWYPGVSFERESTAAYIAAASPDVVLALVRVALAAKVHADATHAGAEVYRGLNDLRDALADLDR